MCTLDKILALVEKNNIKQKDLTDYLGISKNAFTNWKGGFSQSYNRYLPQIAEFFNVSIDYLVGRDEKQGDLPNGVYHGGKAPTIIFNDGLNPKIHKITQLLETKDIPDEVIDFIYKALENYKK